MESPVPLSEIEMEKLRNLRKRKAELMEEINSMEKEMKAVGFVAVSNCGALVRLDGRRASESCVCRHKQ